MAAVTIAIIGGGAAGMMAAITAAKTSEGKCEILLIEHTDRLGKKILATGNGKCNLTNRRLEPEYYRGSNPEFAMEALEEFGFDDTVKFFEEMGLMLRERNGYFYPYSEQAAVVNDILRLELSRLGVKIYLDTKLERITNEKGKFRLHIKGEGKLTADKLIIAAGSKASPKTGSDGSGYELARQLGHKVIKPLPALVQLICKESFFKSISGVRVADVKVTVNMSDRRISERGELQLTDYGISGIPVFQISRFVVNALDKKERFATYIDFLPDIMHNELIMLFKKQACIAEKTIEEVLNGLLNKKLSVLIAKECKLSPNGEFSEIKDKDFYALIDKIKNFRLEVIGSKSFDMAQVCQGGVDTTELNPKTMESRLLKGLYFAGEIIDIDGACGGYNLQWAWTSGYIAGKNAVERAL